MCTCCTIHGAISGWIWPLHCVCDNIISRGRTHRGRRETGSTIGTQAWCWLLFTPHCMICSEYDLTHTSLHTHCCHHSLIMYNTLITEQSMNTQLTHTCHFYLKYGLIKLTIFASEYAWELSSETSKCPKHLMKKWTFPPTVALFQWSLTYFHLWNIKLRLTELCCCNSNGRMSEKWKRKSTMHSPFIYTYTFTIMYVWHV